MELLQLEGVIPESGATRCLVPVGAVGLVDPPVVYKHTMFCAHK